MPYHISTPTPPRVRAMGEPLGATDPSHHWLRLEGIIRCMGCDEPRTGVRAALPCVNPLPAIQPERGAA